MNLMNLMKLVKLVKLMKLMNLLGVSLNLLSGPGCECFSEIFLILILVAVDFFYS